MKRYRVEICRIGYGFAEFIVEAKNKGDAIIKADEKAGDHVFSEKDAEYKVNDIQEVKD